MFIVAVDFDGTICEHKYPLIGKPLPDAIETLKKLRQMGCWLILYTCREGEELDNAVKFCKESGVYFDAVNENIYPLGDNLAKRKIYYDLLIDDKNIGGFIGWNKVLNEIPKNLNGRNLLEFENSNLT